ncbi:MAG: 2-methylfumaryl-CoA isomerase [Streptosporangiales bacterium]|nr:2-methylfumaryl-CoA isomerase [Streptosporangiales bacterium]
MSEHPVLFKGYLIAGCWTRSRAASQLKGVPGKGYGAGARRKGVEVTDSERASNARAAAGPLAGLRIVEVSTYVAAPLGGMTLAQLGAEVIRVDPLGGAPDTRRWPLAPSGTSLYWSGLNKGKRSVVVDFRSERGQDLVAGLVERSGPDGGILLTNAVGRPWLDHESMRRRRPDLISLQVRGHRDGRAAIDYTVNAAVGFPLVTGPREQAGPVNHVLPAFDVACGLYSALGLLAAERTRRATGQGQQVSIALQDVALALAGNLGFLAEAEVNGERRARDGNYLYGAFGRDFTTGDGRHVMVVPLTTRHWRELLEVTGLTGVMAEVEKALGADFSTDDDRFRFREVIAGLLQRWFDDRELVEVERVLGGTSLPWSRYREFADVVGPGRSELLANPMVEEIDQPGVGRHLAPGSPLAFAGSEATVARAPVLGEHTEQVLRDVLALEPAEIAGLRHDGVIEG